MSDPTPRQVAAEWPLGTTVRVGKGKTLWSIASIERVPAGGPVMATLTAQDGYARTTVAPERLVRHEAAQGVPHE